MTSLPPHVATLLSKAALGGGFDLREPPLGTWLSFASSRVPLKLWLSAIGEGLYLAAVSQANVFAALADHGTAISNPLPVGAAGARGVTDLQALGEVVRRAFQLASSLPNEILRVFEAKTAGMPRATEAERMQIVRVGQALFRERLLEYWNGCCAITGLAVPELLRASHIKPWTACADDAERLSVWNGLLLAPHLDLAFDRGFITVADDGEVVVSPRLDDRARHLLGLDGTQRVAALTDGHRAYLPAHRATVFKGAGS